MSGKNTGDEKFHSLARSVFLRAFLRCKDMCRHEEENCPIC